MSGLTLAQKKTVLGSFLGWSLDGYDIVLMLLVVPSISQLFFPSENQLFSILATFATYTVTLIMRPLGGAIFGLYGDKFGRKKSMVITIMGFSIATFSVGLLPTYVTVGIIAPILLILIRLVQGIFAGGEWGSGAVITMESIPKQKRGLFTFFVRLKMDESALWVTVKQTKSLERSPFKKIINKKNRKAFFLCAFVMTGMVYMYHGSISILPTYLAEFGTFERFDIANIMIFATVFSWIGMIFTGWLSQKIGRKKAILYFVITSIIVAIPTAFGILSGGFSIVFFVIIYAFVISTASGPIPAFFSERFSTEIRNSAVGLSYNGGLIFGSWSPLIALSLMSLMTPDMVPLALGLNIIIGAIIVIIPTILSPETKDYDLQ